MKERKKVKHDNIRHDKREVKKQYGNQSYSKTQTRPSTQCFHSHCMGGASVWSMIFTLS